MKPTTLRIRRWLLVLLTVGVLVLFINRLMTIQIVESDYYKTLLDGRYISTQTVKATRGELVDRNGEPLAVNRMGYDVIIDRAYFPSDRQNQVILDLIGQLERLGEGWNDTLPIQVRESHEITLDDNNEYQYFKYKDGQEAEADRLRTFVKVQEYATADQAMKRLISRYRLEDFQREDQCRIASVRYEMEQQGFTWNVPYTFATDIDITSVLQIKERGYMLQGVNVVESAVRTYPNGTIAPHLIGAVGPIYAEEYQALKLEGYAMDDRVGKSGAEKAFEDLLRGTNGERQIHINASGEAVQVEETIAPVAGNTVVLTLDNNLQKVSQDALARQIWYLQNYAAAGRGRESDTGAVVVVKVKTGEVLVAATHPSYDLNTYAQEYSSLAADTEYTPLVNRAVIGVYRPGSIFKPVVATAGLRSVNGEAPVIDEYSTVFCGRVYNFYSGFSPTCLSAHGSYNVIQALTQSCNIFFYDVGRRAGIENIVEVATQYGLGQPTGIEIPESIGTVSSPEAKEADPYNKEPWSGGDTLQSSIGQLYNEFSPLQLANYMATIANYGTRMELTLVHEVRDYTMDTVIYSNDPKVAAYVDAQPEVFETIIRGLVSASSYGGTAAADFGAYPIKVASKTGTPETADLPNSTFICFAPADDPEIAVAVVIEKGWHGYTGAPVAREVFNAYFGINSPSSAAPPAQPDPVPEPEPEQPSQGAEESIEDIQQKPIKYKRFFSKNWMKDCSF